MRFECHVFEVVKGIPINYCFWLLILLSRPLFCGQMFFSKTITTNSVIRRWKTSWQGPNWTLRSSWKLKSTGCCITNRYCSTSVSNEINQANIDQSIIIKSCNLKFTNKYTVLNKKPIVSSQCNSRDFRLKKSGPIGDIWRKQQPSESCTILEKNAD